MISDNFGLFQSEVDTRLFVGVGKVDFRRIESLISRPRTGQKEQNIEFQSGSVVYFGLQICEYIGFCKYRIFRRKYVCSWSTGQISCIFTRKTLRRRVRGYMAGKPLALEKYAWSGRKTLFLLTFFDSRELRAEGVR